MKAFQHLRIETLPMLVFYQSAGLPRSRPSNEQDRQMNGSCPAARIDRIHTRGQSLVVKSRA
jgi:hypothetical protein